MAAIVRLQEHGEITLPEDIRELAGVSPGDELVIRSIGPGRIELATTPRMSLTELIRKHQVDVPAGDVEQVIREAEQELADEYR